MKIEKLKLIQHLKECLRHWDRLNYAYSNLMPLAPLIPEQYENLTDLQIEHIDQFMFRFSKLQDAMGERLFKSLLLCLQEDIKSMPFIDRLNRLEELSLISDKQQWLVFRKLRNDISHEYPDQIEKNTDTINSIYQSIPSLFLVLLTIHKYIDLNIISNLESTLVFPKDLPTK